MTLRCRARPIVTEFNGQRIMADTLEEAVNWLDQMAAPYGMTGFEAERAGHARVAQSD